MYHDTVTHSRDSPTTTILRTSVSPIIHIYGNLYIYIIIGKSYMLFIKLLSPLRCWVTMCTAYTNSLGKY